MGKYQHEEAVKVVVWFGNDESLLALGPRRIAPLVLLMPLLLVLALLALLAPHGRAAASGFRLGDLDLAAARGRSKEYREESGKRKKIEKVRKMNEKESKTPRDYGEDGERQKRTDSSPSFFSCFAVSFSFFSASLSFFSFLLPGEGGEAATAEPGTSSSAEGGLPPSSAIGAELPDLAGRSGERASEMEIGLGGRRRICWLHTQLTGCMQPCTDRKVQYLESGV